MHGAGGGEGYSIPAEAPVGNAAARWLRGSSWCRLHADDRCVAGSGHNRANFVIETGCKYG